LCMGCCLDWSHESSSSWTNQYYHNTTHSLCFLTRMIHFSALAIVLLALLAFVSLVQPIVVYDTSRGHESIAESVLEAMNPEVNPCDDFYEVCSFMRKQAV